MKMLEQNSITRFISSVRQVAGKPNVYRAYVYDVRTGKQVGQCKHNHGARRKHLGFDQALSCGEQMVAVAERSAAT